LPSVGRWFHWLAAAYDLANAGHHVDLFEASARLGGLAAGLKEHIGSGRWKPTIITGSLQIKLFGSG